MKITVEAVNGGFIATVEGETLPRVYRSVEEHRMWEELGKKLFGKRIEVKDK